MVRYCNKRRCKTSTTTTANAALPKAGGTMTDISHGGTAIDVANDLL